MQASDEEPTRAGRWRGMIPAGHWLRSSLLLGSSIGSIAGGDPARFGAMAACTALLTATIAFLAWLARAGWVVNFVSETVLIGFKAGVALQLASTQEFLAQRIRATEWR